MNDTFSEWFIEKRGVNGRSRPRCHRRRVKVMNNLTDRWQSSARVPFQDFSAHFKPCDWFLIDKFYLHMYYQKVYIFIKIRSAIKNEDSYDIKRKKIETKSRGNTPMAPLKWESLLALLSPLEYSFVFLRGVSESDSVRDKGLWAACWTNGGSFDDHI